MTRPTPPAAGRLGRRHSFMGRKILRKIVLIVVCLAAADLAAGLAFYLAVTRAMSPPEISRFDAAVVLWGDTNSLGPETRRRLNQVLKLHQAGRIDQVICVGGARENFSGAEAMKRFLVAQGLSPEKIFTDHNSFDTWTNWREAQKIIREQKFQSVVFVSDPFHLFRLKHLLLRPEAAKPGLWFHPYAYAEAVPRAGWSLIWKRIHYEWIACLLWIVLPESLYEPVVRQLRY